MSKFDQLDFGAKPAGETLPVALKTPPNSMGLRSSVAPARWAIASTWESAR
jgi:hypothetical protein